MKTVIYLSIPVMILCSCGVVTKKPKPRPVAEQYKELYEWEIKEQQRNEAICNGTFYIDEQGNVKFQPADTSDDYVKKLQNAVKEANTGSMFPH